MSGPRQYRLEDSLLGAVSSRIAGGGSVFVVSHIYMKSLSLRVICQFTGKKKKYQARCSPVTVAVQYKEMKDEAAIT